MSNTHTATNIVTSVTRNREHCNDNVQETSEVIITDIQKNILAQVDGYKKPLADVAKQAIELLEARAADARGKLESMGLLEKPKAIEFGWRIGHDLDWKISRNPLPAWQEILDAVRAVPGVESCTVVARASGGRYNIIVYTGTAAHTEVACAATLARRTGGPTFTVERVEAPKPNDCTVEAIRAAVLAVEGVNGCTITSPVHGELTVSYTCPRYSPITHDFVTSTVRNAIAFGVGFSVARVGSGPETKPAETEVFGATLNTLETAERIVKGALCGRASVTLERSRAENFARSYVDTAAKDKRIAEQAEKIRGMRANIVVLESIDSKRADSHAALRRELDAAQRQIADLQFKLARSSWPGVL